MQTITHQQAFDLLKKYNKDSFHIQHALTVEAVMKWYANELGYGEDAEYWGIVGLLHDIDFELYPAEHCLKAPELLREAGVGEDVIHAVCSHGYGITVECGATIDVEPEHEMEKVLFAADELTGLIWAAALMRPSKRYGTEITQEKIQSKRICSWMFPRSNRPRSGAAWLGTGQTVGNDNPCNGSFGR